MKRLDYRFRIRIILAAILLLGCGIGRAETLYYFDTPSLKNLGKITYIIKMPGFAPKAGLVGVKYGAEVQVDGIFGICSIDTKLETKPADSHRLWRSGAKKVMLANGDTTGASGTWYLTIQCADPNFKEQKFRVRIDVKQATIVTGSARLAPNQAIHLVCHGRVGRESDFAVLSGNIQYRRPLDSVFRADWSDGASANYPSTLSGSRFIKPAAQAISTLLLNASVSPSKLTLWGHSWGSYVMYETGLRVGRASSLILMDPAKTGLSADLVGNEYRGANFTLAAARTFSLVAAGCHLGGQPEAGTAGICIVINPFDKIGRFKRTSEFPSSVEDIALHTLPVRCVEYALRNFDPISKKITSTAFREQGGFLNRVDGLDYNLDTWSDGSLNTTIQVVKFINPENTSFRFGH